MAKKAKVKPRSLTANVGNGLPSLSANLEPMDLPSIGANLGSLSQDIDSVEQSNKVDKLRKSAKERIKNRVPGKPAVNDNSKDGGKAEVIPPGTFKNVDGELVVGDMKKFQAGQMKKKKATVKKK